MRLQTTLERIIAAVAMVVLLFAPKLFSLYTVTALLTQGLIFGIAAASLIFLAANMNAVSLAQTGIFGVAGFVVGNATTADSKGMNENLSPWLGLILGIVLATLLGVLLGSLAARSVGIYFLMITLTYSVIGNTVFSSVTNISGFGGISGIVPPSIIGTPDQHAFRLYYVALAVAVLVYLLVRYLAGTPFGVAMRGVGGDDVRMSSLGFNCNLQRVLAFTVGAFIASLGGVLFVWWNGHIDPQTIGLTSTVELLVMAVIGGLRRIEGAWIGAFAFVLLNDRFAGNEQVQFAGVAVGTFATVIGLIFLLIVLVSPDGLLGLWERVMRAIQRRLPGSGGNTNRLTTDAT